METLERKLSEPGETAQLVSLIGRYYAMDRDKRWDRVQRAYYLDRDIDKALRRMALEEGKNLTESINDALRKGLVEYL